MKRATRSQARAYSMTIEEAGVATVDRALQIEGSATALLSREQSKLDDWESQLRAWAENRPWEFLPDDAETKYGKVWVWTSTRLRINGDPLTRDRLVALLAGLMGTVALADERINAFEAEIRQPLHPGKAGNPTGANQHTRNRYPDNGSSGSTPQAARRGTSTSYLMARLLRADPDVATKIGKGKPYRSINHAAQELGIVAPRQRYEVNPEVDVEHAADRIFHVLGQDKAAELVIALTSRLTPPSDQ